MAQLSLKQLEAFVHVADLASFRRAAEKLNTTQPNISSRIAGLEGQLGVRLLDRDAGSVRLTPTGETLLEKARDVIRGVDAFLVAAGEDHLFEGVLRLGVTEMIVHSWLGPFLTAVKSRFPHINIDLTVDFSANLTEELHNRSIDLALQSEPFGRQTSGNCDLGDFPMIWVAAKSLGFSDDTQTLRDFAQHSVMTHARGTMPFEQLKDHIASVADTNVRLVPSTNVTACLQMTRDGLGIACLPEIMLRADIESGVLSKLDYPWTPDPLRFKARFEKETTPSYVAEIAALAQQISRSSFA